MNCFNDQTEAWDEYESVVLNTARADHSIAYLNGLVCVVGGQGGSILTETECLQWQWGATGGQWFWQYFPQYNLNVPRAGAVVLNIEGKQCIVGGLTGSGSEIAGSTECFNGTRWILANPTLAQPRTFAVPMLLDGYSCVVGGYQPVTAVSGYLLASAECWDPVLAVPPPPNSTLNATYGAFRTLATLRIPRALAAALTVDGMPCIAGGNVNGTQLTDLVECYNSSTGGFTVLSASISRKVSGLSSATLAGYSCVVGGSSGSNESDCYDPQSQQFVRKYGLSLGHYRAAAFDMDLGAHPDSNSPTRSPTASPTAAPTFISLYTPPFDGKPNATRGWMVYKLELSAMLSRGPATLDNVTSTYLCTLVLTQVGNYSSGVRVNSMTPCNCSYQGSRVLVAFRLPTTESARIERIFFAATTNSTVTLALATDYFYSLFLVSWSSAAFVPFPFSSMTGVKLAILVAAVAGFVLLVSAVSMVFSRRANLSYVSVAIVTTVGGGIQIWFASVLKQAAARDAVFSGFYIFMVVMVVIPIIVTFFANCLALKKALQMDTNFRRYSSRCGERVMLSLTFLLSVFDTGTLCILNSELLGLSVFKAGMSNETLKTFSSIGLAVTVGSNGPRLGVQAYMLLKYKDEQGWSIALPLFFSVLVVLLASCQKVYSVGYMRRGLDEQKSTQMAVR